MLYSVKILLLCSFGYFFGWLSGKILKWDKDVVVTLTFSSGMRNMSSGAILAIAYFPASVAVPVISGILFQQMLASVCGRILTLNDRKAEPSLENAAGL